MKKLYVLFAFLLIAALALAACSSGNENEKSETPVATTAAGVTAVPTATIAPTATTVPTVTVAPTASPVANSATATAGLANTGGKNSPDLASILMDSELYDQQGNDLGKIDNLVLDFRNEKASYMVLKSGGVLGIGAKDILLPWSKVQYSPKDNKTAFVFNGNSDLVKKAPTVDNLKGIDFNNPTWDANYLRYWETGVLSTTTPTATANAATAVPTATPAATSAPNVIVSSLNKTFLADDFIGKTVVDVDGKTVGKINNIVIDHKSGKISYALMSADNSLNIGDKMIPVPVRSFGLNADHDLVLRATTAQLVKAPNYDPDGLPDFTAPGWDAKLRSFWAGITS